MDKRSSQLQLTRLSIEQAACLQRLMESNPGHSQSVTGAVPAADASIEALTALPPTARAEQKIDLGRAFTNAYIAEINNFDAVKVKQQAAAAK